MKEQAAWKSRGTCCCRGNTGVKAGVEAALYLVFEASWEARVCGAM